MPLAERLSEYVRACFTGLWIRSSEPDEALTEIAQLCRQENWQLATWDIDRGFLVADGQASAGAAATDPLAALRAVSTLGAADGTLLVVLKNLHRFLNSAEIVQALVHQLAAGKQRRVFFVVLAPVVQLPIELEKLFVVLEHELPRCAELLEIAQGIATEAGELPRGARVGTCSGGGVWSDSLRSGRRLFAGAGAPPADRAFHDLGTQEPDDPQKRPLVAVSRRRELCRAGRPGVAQGLLFTGAALSFYGRAAVRSRCLALGVAGTGKSAFCKALGNETGRPTLVLDVGSLMGSLVGQTEERTARSLTDCGCVCSRPC